MPLSVLQIINIAKVSQYLASIDVEKGTLYSPRIIPQSSQMIYMELKAVDWAYNLTLATPNGGNLNVSKEEVVGIDYHLYLSGIPVAGDILTITMTDTISSAVEIFTYTVNATDTIESIYQNLEALILASPDFNASISYGLRPYLIIDSDSGINQVSGTTSVTLNLPDTSLTETANYLYSICRGYNLQATKIIGGGGGSLYIYQQDNLASNYDLYLAGIANAGDETVLVMTDSLTNTATFSYTASGGDSAAKIMTELATLINASTDFNAVYNPGIHPYISVQSNYGLVTVDGITTINYAF
jgi:hypothetical protein